MDRRRFLLISLAGALAATVAAGAQQADKVYRVGFILTGAANEVEHLTKELDDGLRELGYVEGRNVVFERRFAGGRQEGLVVLAAELVRLNVDIIVTGSNPVISAVKQATATIPVVMAVSRDPVGAGFIASLARPGGNITGLTSDPDPQILAKNLQLLKEAVPTASRVALLWNPLQTGAEAYRKAIEDAARSLGVTLQLVEVRRRSEFDGAFSAMAQARVQAIVVLPDPVVFTARTHLAVLAARNRLPAIYGHPEHAEVGGLMAYGGKIAHQFHRAAAYVDTILKGAKPGDLAVEQPTKFELVINLKTAKALGLTIPPSLLARADQIIE
jgi:putative tryptophan/tyrosine transport system substrate-binding protein